MVSNFNEMYAKLPNLVLGFHGCRLEVYDKVIKEGAQLKKSENKYDWLGPGIYFWENSYERAMEWASARYKDEGRVIGAIVDLGRCLNLTDYQSTGLLAAAYEVLKKDCEATSNQLPVNSKGHSKTDLLLRNLDCAVVQRLHAMIKESQLQPFDSVRGIFTEGEEIYPGAGFVKKTHVQLCVINPNCIKGYFAPIKFDKNYNLP